MTRRRISATLDGHHWCQQRTLLPLLKRRPFHADTRRGFPTPPLWVIGQHWLAGARLLGLQADACERALRDSSLGRGFRQASQGDKAPRTVSRELPWGPCSPINTGFNANPTAHSLTSCDHPTAPASDQGTVCEGRGYPDTPRIE